MKDMTAISAYFRFFFQPRGRGAPALALVGAALLLAACTEAEMRGEGVEEAVFPQEGPGGASVFAATEPETPVDVAFVLEHEDEAPEVIEFVVEREEVAEVVEEVVEEPVVETAALPEAEEEVAEPEVLAEVPDLVAQMLEADATEPEAEMVEEVAVAEEAEESAMGNEMVEEADTAEAMVDTAEQGEMVEEPAEKMAVAEETELAPAQAEESVMGNETVEEADTAEAMVDTAEQVGEVEEPAEEMAEEMVEEMGEEMVEETAEATSEEPAEETPEAATASINADTGLPANMPFAVVDNGGSRPAPTVAAEAQPTPAPAPAGGGNFAAAVQAAAAQSGATATGPILNAPGDGEILVDEPEATAFGSKEMFVSVEEQEIAGSAPSKFVQEIGFTTEDAPVVEAAVVDEVVAPPPTPALPASDAPGSGFGGLALAMGGGESESTYPSKGEYGQIDPNPDPDNPPAGIFGTRGISLFGGFGGDDDEENIVLPVNPFLWQAALDVLSFMPLASQDPLTGVIITEWHARPENPGERFKLVAYVRDQDLRVTSLRVSVFRQEQAQDGSWQDAVADESVATGLETTILKEARRQRAAAIEAQEEQ